MSDKLVRQDSPKVSDQHHTREWPSGTQGGGKVPADFGWHSNPKQSQEENGANDLPPLKK